MTALGAQSLTAGGLAGTVRGEGDRALDAVDVTAIDVASGLSRTAVTDRRGRFRFALLPPGEYELLAERLGYRPRRLRGVPVRPGASVEVPLALVAAAPPVAQIDTSVFDPGVSLGGRAGISQWYTPFAVTGLPDRERPLADLVRLSTAGGADLALEGLSAGSSGFMLDGIPYASARHSALLDGPPPGFALSAFDRAELVTGGSDVQWTGFGAGTLNGYGRRGSPALAVRALADWTGGALTDSKYFDTGAQPNASVRGAAVVSGPVIRDTAHFALGLEVQQRELPRPPSWEAGPLADSVIAVARDSFGIDLSGSTRASLTRTDAASAFGRFDWQLSASHLLSVGGNFATATVDNFDPGRGAIPSLGARLEATDLLVDATLSSVFGSRVSQELRVGVTRSKRVYFADSLRGTAFTDLGIAAGSDPVLPGQFERTTIFVGQTLHFQTRAHRLKLGASATVPKYDQTYAYAQTGGFTFGGVDEFARRQGVFDQVTGAIPTAQFTATQYGAYLQDTWEAVPGFELLLGLRFDIERLPRSEVHRDTVWRDTSGLDNTAFPSQVGKLSPRLAFTWDIGNRQAWVVTGEAGVYHDAVDPGVFGELITGRTSLQARHGVGTLSAWPGVPDAASAPAVGPRLTLLGPDFRAPRSARFSLGISRALGRAAVLRLAGIYRHTDFLPRRHDINLLQAPAGRDQYGRPLYGTLVQQGSALVATPRSNRRFPGFDLVSALDPDGAANYVGGTVSLERPLGRSLNLLASYTYSRTTDNWLSGRPNGPGPIGQLTPFPDSLNGADWADGRSDFDVPHRVVAAVGLTVHRLRGLRLAALYRYQSGYPFTPGFRTGVDANGDGSDRNDPAFVDDTLPGVARLFDKWECLRGQAGQFAERNSCREPAIHALDLRVAFPVTGSRRFALTVVVDALNVIESDAGERDRAVLLVDHSAAVTTNPVTGVTTVPLVVNPSFGEPLRHRTPGRFWRVGLQVNW